MEQHFPLAKSICENLLLPPDKIFSEIPLPFRKEMEHKTEVHREAPAVTSQTPQSDMLDHDSTIMKNGY